MNKSNLVPIPGYPGAFTFKNIVRDPKAEKKLIKKINRDAEKIRKEREK